MLSFLTELPAPLISIFYISHATQEAGLNREENKQFVFRSYANYSG